MRQLDPLLNTVFIAADRFAFEDLFQKFFVIKVIFSRLGSQFLIVLADKRQAQPFGVSFNVLSYSLSRQRVPGIPLPVRPEAHRQIGAEVPDRLLS